MSISPIPIDIGRLLKPHQLPRDAPERREQDHVQRNDIVCWHRLQHHGLRRLTTSYTTLDPHPQDWDERRLSGSNHPQFIEARIADLREMEDWLGENPISEGVLCRADPARPERRATVAVRVIASSSCAVATLNWTGLRNVVTDVIIAVPGTKVENFDPKTAFVTIATLSDRDKLVLEDKVVSHAQKERG